MGSHEPARATGRPMAADPSEVAAIGLRLFAREGYENVTMSRIAEAAGIGRTTLVRYFPSKAHIVWDRADEDANRLELLLRSVSVDQDPVDELCRVLPAALAYADDEFDLLRTQVRIITSSAVDLLSHARTGVEEVMLRYLRTVPCSAPSELRSRIAARCLLDAGWLALVAWAESDEARPDRMLKESYDFIRSGLR